ncbi:Calcineurin-like phosphoesterase domain-containing protein [Entamoeba marina]
MISSTKRFTIISDTHNLHQHLQIRTSDFLLICGDFTNRGNTNDFKSFTKWLKHQPTKNVVMIFGNHERGLLKSLNPIEELQRNVKSLHVLKGDKIHTIDGFQFYGMGYPFKKLDFSSLYFDLNKPLITLSHEPPYRIMDFGIRKRQFVNGHFFHAGSSLVKRFTQTINPHMHCFGHCHSSHGTCKIGKTLYINGSLVNDHGNLHHKPIEVDFISNHFQPKKPTQMYFIISIS